MNPSGGYDFEAVGDMGIDFECPICLLLLREAAELPCLHVFCKLCLENWQVSPMERNTELLCPSCKNVYQNDQINGTKYVDKLIKTSLHVKCKENNFGCEWKGTILDYANHEIKCSYKSINCDFVGCEKRILRIDQPKHRSQCPYRSVQCQHCKSEIQFINLETHYGLCTEYIVNCPNEECSVAKPRREIGDHTQNECPYQVINCNYVSVGCSHKFQRQHTNEHENEALAEHMNLLLNRVQITSMELCTVKEKLQITEEKLLQTEKTLVATNENLENTKTILNETKDALQNTKADLIKANDTIVHSNKSIEELERDNHETNKICFQLTRFAVCVKYRQNISSSRIVESLKSLADVNAEGVKLIPKEVLEFDTKYGKNIHSPNNLPVLQKTLEDEWNVINTLPELYPDRFEQVMDMLETNKLYKLSDNEIFVKVDLTNHIHCSLHSYFEKVSSRAELQKRSGTLFDSKEFMLFCDSGTCQVMFFLPAWNSWSISFVVGPMENSMTEFPINMKVYDNKLVTLNNMALIKGVRQ